MHRPPLAMEYAMLGPSHAASPFEQVLSRIEAAAAAQAAVADILNIPILWKKSRKMRGVHGTFNPSLWRWYHRHGYWATRRKLIDFGTKRKYRYHQVAGAGKRSMAYGKKILPALDGQILLQ